MKETSQMTDKLSKFKSVCRDFNISLAYLFGSQAKTGLKILNNKSVFVDDPLSDIDLGIVLDGPLPSLKQRTKFYGILYNSLEDLFHPLRLDLVLLEENHSVFQLEAIKGICIYQLNEEQRDFYEINILRRAADFRPFLTKFYQELLEEV